jgi:hypothetical protein
MSPIHAPRIEVDADELHVIRRLGRALVQRWALLPPELQELLVEQATFMEDEEQRVHVNDSIKAFIAKHQP